MDTKAKRNYKKSVPVCRDPMCIDECACFAAYRDGHKILCSALNNTDFKNKWCPFFKTREQVLKEDPRFYERINKNG